MLLSFSARNFRFWAKLCPRSLHEGNTPNLKTRPPLVAYLSGILYMARIFVLSVGTYNTAIVKSAVSFSYFCRQLLFMTRLISKSQIAWCDIAMEASEVKLDCGKPHPDYVQIYRSTLPISNLAWLVWVHNSDRGKMNREVNGMIWPSKTIPSSFLEIVCRVYNLSCPSP